MKIRYYIIILLFLNINCKDDGSNRRNVESETVSSDTITQVKVIQGLDTNITAYTDVKHEVKSVESIKKEPAKNANIVKTPPETQKASEPILTWLKDTYDFGEIPEGTIINHTFVFENTGTGPLQIQKTEVTCGCTTPTFPFKDILPGEKGEIKVKYNSVGKDGLQSPQITVYANTKNHQHFIKLQGKITPKVPIDTIN